MKQKIQREKKRRERYQGPEENILNTNKDPQYLREKTGRGGRRKKNDGERKKKTKGQKKKKTE